jgi:hypothetical protein
MTNSPFLGSVECYIYRQKPPPRTVEMRNERWAGLESDLARGLRNNWEYVCERALEAPVKKTYTCEATPFSESCDRRSESSHFLE